MRVLKPEWVGNEERPIFSIDIHPDGSRCATGGQGDKDCGKVVIWNMAPIRDEKEEKNDVIPKLLCQMESHNGCVNCVKWSNDGKYLASGSDDKYIMIWQTSRYDVAGSSSFGSSGKTVNVEQWRCASTLRGHDGDILDLAWSPNDVWLASCSVDNTVIIWNAKKFPEILSVLKGHTSLVKGVCWDPVGKYLATQSDDKTLRIWRTHDWGQEARVVEPFKTTSGTTHILRLHWSPDGQYLVSAHAMNNSGPSAQIIERDGWKTNRDFVGHRKAITVARFNPFILSKTMSKSNGKDKSEKVTCCAIGSRDRSLSVWLTSLKRPLIVLHDLFTNSVLDISWGRCGTELMACSWDGTIAYLQFSEEEIGVPFSHSEMSHFYQTVYGKNIASIGVNGFPNGMTNGNDPNAVVEDPEILNLQKQQAQKQKEAAALAAANEHSNGLLTPPKGPTSKQIETRTKEGRRRITPLFLAPQPDLADTPLPFNSSNIVSSSTKGPSQIVVEKKSGAAAAVNGLPDATTNHSNGLIGSTPDVSPPKAGEMNDVANPNDAGEKPEGSPSSASTLSPPSPAPTESFTAGNGISSFVKNDSTNTATRKDTSIVVGVNGTATSAEKLPPSQPPSTKEVEHNSANIPNGQLPTSSSKDGKPAEAVVSNAGTTTTTSAPTSTPITDTPVNKLASFKRKNDAGSSNGVGASSGAAVGVPDKKKLKKDVMSRFNHPSSGTTTEGFAQPALMTASSTATPTNVIVANHKPTPTLPPLTAPIRSTLSTPSVVGGGGAASSNGAYPLPHHQLPVSSSTAASSVRASRTESSALHLPTPDAVKSNTFTLYVPKVAASNRCGTTSSISSSSSSLLTIYLENHVTVGRSHVLHRVRVTVSSPLPPSPTSSAAAAPNAPPDVVWEHFLERPVLVVEASEKVTCVACDDSTLHLFSSTSGTRLFPAIVVGSKASVLKVASHYVMVLTCSAKLFLWSTDPMTSIVRNAALNPIMKSGDTISMEGTLLTSDGAPMLTISTGKTFSYSAGMGSWILISGGVEDPLYQLSDHSTSAFLSASTPCSSSSLKDSTAESRPLARAQRATRARPSDSARNMFSANAKGIAGTPQSVVATVSHLEIQVQSAMILKSPDEYKLWLGTYVRYLAKQNIQCKIRETFDMLIGPMPSGTGRGDEGKSMTAGCTGDDREWEPEILGMSKHDLLNEFLPAVGSHLSMQRLYAEYKEHLAHLVNGKSQRDNLFARRF